MRISDWSSDVCSSDLNADLEFVHFKIAHVLPVRLDHGERNAGDAEVEESHSAAVDDPQPDSLTGREQEFQVVRGRVAVDEEGIRSEEHTSELQSLMRISYAVFCVKKKNNRTQAILTL